MRSFIKLMNSYFNFPRNKKEKLNNENVLKLLLHMSKTFQLIQTLLYVQLIFVFY